VDIDFAHVVRLRNPAGLVNGSARWDRGGRPVQWALYVNERICGFGHDFSLVVLEQALEQAFSRY
jgi:hypothetical protein